MEEFPRIFELHKETQKPVFLPVDESLHPTYWYVIDYKEYPRFPSFPLPTPKSIEASFSDVLKDRRSTRQFDSVKTISSQEISNLLYWSVGERKKEEGSPSVRRMHPSGGGRYPVEIYLSFIGNEEIPQGVYHYNYKKHSLEQLFTEEKEKELRALPNYPFVKDAAIILFISGVYARSVFKYKERGYRFLLLEAGIILENLHLVSGALSLSSCAIGTSIDTMAEELLELSPEEETILTHLIIGR